MSDAVVLRFTDRLIEAAATARGSNHVPEADAAFGKPTQSLIVRERLQLLADGKAEQPPELVGRVRVITLRCERSVAGQAPEDEQPRVRSSDRR